MVWRAQFISDTRCRKPNFFIANDWKIGVGVDVVSGILGQGFFGCWHIKNEIVPFISKVSIDLVNLSQNNRKTILNTFQTGDVFNIEYPRQMKFKAHEWLLWTLNECVCLKRNVFYERSVRGKISIFHRGIWHFSIKKPPPAN